MARIIVRFVRADGFVSGAIAEITNSFFSHAEFGIENLAQEIVAWLGAHAGTGIEKYAPNYAKEKLEYRYGVPCTDAQYQTWLKWAESQIGKKYNYADIAGLLFHDRKLNNAKEDICSEFVTLGLEQVFPGKVLNALAEYAYLVTPETLHLSPLFVGNLILKAV
jgi:hypothetical protein